MLAALLAALIGCGPGVPTEPSIIILDVDTLRADHLGCYGHHRPTSPNIDALARESIRFEWAFSQAPNTPPAQGSILTGLYPSAHGLVRHGDRSPDRRRARVAALSDETMQRLRALGYLGGDGEEDEGHEPVPPVEAVFADGFESGDREAWSTPGPPPP